MKDVLKEQRNQKYNDYVKQVTSVHSLPFNMLKAFVTGGVICVIAAIAGDTSQDLKTGYIVGSTPKKQQIGELIGVVASALAIGGVLYLLNKAWGYGTDELPAPQAMIMKTVVEGVMDGNLPWNMILAGAAIAVVIEILGIPVMPVAVGLYLQREIKRRLQERIC